MDKYVRVDWPELQKWMADEFEDDLILAWDNEVTIGFVPEDLYNQVMAAVDEPTIPDESDPIWDEYEGMPEESKPWFMKNE